MARLSSLALFPLSALLLACPGGSGNGPNVVEGTPLVVQSGLTLEDSSSDGSLVAYTDEADTLFVVSTAGGAPVEIAEGIDRARFRGGFLLAFSGLSPDEETAAVLSAFRQGEATPAFTGTRVVLASIEDSPDGQHLYFESNQAADPSLEDVFLDGQQIFSGVGSARGRFSPAGDLLVVSTTDPLDQSELCAFPLAGGPSLLLATGNSGRFQITPDGAQVLLGANEDGPIVDLTLVDSSGSGAETPVVAQVSDNGFRLLKDSATLAFLNLAGGVEVIGLDGSGQTTLVSGGALDTEETSGDAIVYITSVDPASDLPSLRLVRADGALDVPLGTLAVSEGFSPDGAFYFFRDSMRVDPDTLEPKDGTLRFVSTSTGEISTLAVEVKKASVSDNTRVLFLTRNDLLQIADVATGERRILEDFVDRFDLVSEAQAAFSIKDGPQAGVYITSF